MNEEHIKIILSAIDDASPVLKNVSQRMNASLGKTKDAQDRFNNATKLTTRTQMQLGDAMLNVSQTTNASGRVLSRGISYTASTIKRFRMELLSVMFFGMGIYNMFGGWVKQAADLTGITGWLSSLLMFMMLPAVIALIPAVAWLSDKILDLDENQRKLFGDLVILIAIVALALMLFGMFGLGIDGITKAFKFLAPVIAVVKGIINILIAHIWEVILVLGLLYAAWLMRGESMWKSIKFIFEGIGDILYGFIDILSGIFDIIMGLMTGNTERLFAGFKKIFDGFCKIWVGIAKVLAGIATLILNIIFGVLAAIMNVIGTTMGMVDSLIDWVLDVLSKIPGIGDYAKELAKIKKEKPMFAPGGIGAFGIFEDIFKEAANVFRSPYLFQEGGIVTKPTLGMLGERGSEAIIPLGENMSSIINPPIINPPTINPTTINYSPMITINADITSDIDMDTLAETISKRGIDDLKKFLIK